MNTGDLTFKSMAESDVYCHLLAVFVTPSKRPQMYIYTDTHCFSRHFGDDFCFPEYNALAGQGGEKDQFYLRPISDLPTAPRGVCD